MRKHLVACALSLGAAVALGATAQAAVPPGDSCPNASVRALQGATRLPDCRAYEQISPAAKFGYQVGGNSAPEFALAVSPDGERVAYAGISPLGPSAAASLAAFVSDRGLAEWTTRGVFAPPGPMQAGMGLPGHDAVLRGTTPDQRVSVYYDNTTVPYGTLWKYDHATGVRKLIASASRTVGFRLAGEAPGQPWFQGMSDDGRHVVFTSTDPLLPGLVDNGNAILYEWVDDGANGGAGTLRVVNRSDAAELERIDPAPASLGGTPLPVAEAFVVRLTGTRNAISANGRVIVFQVAPAALGGQYDDSPGGGPLYVRIDGQQTVEISAPAEGHVPTSPPSLYRYLEASHSADDEQVDGRFVFFWADGDLTAGAPVEGGIYRFDVAAEELEFLTSVGGPPTQAGQLAALASEDGSRLYFQDFEDIRRYEDGNVTTVLASADAQGGLPLGDGSVSRSNGLDSGRCSSADVSRDGRYFVFSARVAWGPLGVFRYDAVTDELTTVAAPGTDTGFPSAGTCNATYAPNIETRLMSDDGRQVFFATRAAMVAGDDNGQWDVYRWRDGDVALITTGDDPRPSLFVGVDEAGASPVFTSTTALVPQDGDRVYDYYTARVGGGYVPPAGVSQCVDDGCQGAVGPGRPTARVTPDSVGYRGRGDLSGTRLCVSLESRSARLAARRLVLSRKARRAAGKRSVRLRTQARAVRKQAKAVRRQLAVCRRAR